MSMILHRCLKSAILVWCASLLILDCAKGQTVVHANGSFCVGSENLFAFSGSQAVTSWSITGTYTIISTSTNSINIEWTAPVSGAAVVANYDGGSATYSGITVNESATPSVDISGSANNVCPGTSVTFTASPTNGGSSPYYNWYVNGNNVSNGSSNTYTSTSLANGDQVICRLGSSIACATTNDVASNTVTMSVLSLSNMSVTISPADTGCTGAQVSYIAAAVDTPTSVTYQWYLDGNPITSLSEGQPPSVLILNTSSVSNNDIISCVLTTNTSCYTQASSNNLTVTLKPPQTFIVSTNVGGDINICQGTSVTFSASGNFPISSYQWSINGSPVTGATSGTFIATASSAGQLQSVSLTATTPTNICVSNTSATGSASAIPFVVNPQVSPSVSIASPVSDTICLGTAVAFTATTANAGSTPGYQWQVDGINVSGATGSSFSTTDLGNGDSVDVVLTSSALCASPSTATSNALKISFHASVGTISPISGPTSVLQGGTSQYAASASDASGYNWTITPAAAGTIDGMGNVSWSDDAFGGVATISVAPLGCDAGTQTSTLNVTLDPPLAGGTILSGNSTLNVGENAGMIVASPAIGGTCSGTYNYQWQQSSNANGTFNNINGATGVSYNPGPIGSTSYFQRQTSCGTETAYTNVVAIKVVSTGAPSDINYIRIRDISRPEIADTATAANLTSVWDVQQTTDYFDGLGRPVQSVAHQASPSLNDMVSIHVYDPYERESVKYMPFTSSSNDGSYKSDAISQQDNFNTTQFAGEQDNYFSDANIELSQLSRPLGSYSPGASWVGSGRGITHQYLYNTTGDSVHIWSIPLSGTIIPVDSGLYTPGQLYKDLTVDEQGHQVLEYKNKEGRLILKKVQSAATPGSAHVGWLCTYYVYDDVGNLRFVIPPRAVELINTGSTWSISQQISDELCFHYEYDDRERITVKKVPGAGEVWMAYDVRDLQVMTQDANMRKVNHWLVTQYDELDRPVETGFINYSATLADLQQQVTNQTGSGATISGLPTDTTISSSNTIGEVTALRSVTMQNGFSSLTGGIFIADIENGAWGTGGSTTNNDSVASSPVPPGVVLQPLTFTYYDDYSWVAGTGIGLTANFASAIAGNGNYFVTSYNSSPVYAAPISPYTSAKGAVTGTQTLVLGTPGQYLYSVNFYDDHNRLIQTQSLNSTGGVDTMTIQYDFTGKPIRSLLGQAKVTNTAQYHEVLTKTNYDPGFRLTSIWKNIDRAPSDQLIDSMQYNELGQLRAKYLGKDQATGAPLDSLVYDYNIRGWITGINKNYVGGTSQHYFGMELGYDNPASVSGASYATPAFNGNIAGVVWKSAGDQVDRKYDFSYDPVNRLTGAAYLDNHSGSSWDHNTMDYSVDSLSYDANGNILTMNQHGYKLGAPTGDIDVLKYGYEYYGASNKLTQVQDAENDTSSTLGDFHYKGAKSDSDYRYDGNGNLTIDNNKGIDSIYYNYLNLPQQVHITGKGNIFYTYDAAGDKLTKQTVDSAAGIVTTTLYLDGSQYQRRTSLTNSTGGSDTLQFVGHEEGRARWAFHKYLAGDSAYSLEYDFYEKDHLGNTRILLSQEKDTAQYVATMESAYRATEDALFYNIDSTSFAASQVPGNGFSAEPNGTQPNDSVVKVDGAGQKMGPAILLKVMSGDSISLGVYAYYTSTGAVPSPSSSLNNVINSLASGLATLTGASHAGIATMTAPSSGPVYNAVSSFLPAMDTNTISMPKAYLNWMLVDNQFNYVSGNGQSGAIPVGQPDGLRPLATTIKLNHSGYLYIWVSNETPNWPVFFDNLSIQHFNGPLIEENHYYPFGLTMAGISDQALKTKYAENKYRFNKGSELQNKEFSDGSGLEMYETHLRELDPQLGRWWQIDPKASESESPYASMGNNPVRFNDPLGDTIIDAQIKADKNWGKVYKTWLNSKAGKAFTKLYSPGGKYGSTTVTFKVGKTNDDNSAQANTKVYDVNRKTGTETKLETGVVYKGIDKVAEGKSSSDYLKFDITVRDGDEANTPEQQIENAEGILHETQHVRIDQQTLSTNSEMAPSAVQHYYWMKPTTSDWYKERANFYLENRQLWQADYDRQKAQGKVKNEAEYIKSKVNDFVN